MSYREPARATTRRRPTRTRARRIRIRRIRAAGLLVVIAATAVLGYRSLASSSSTAAQPTDVPRREHRGALGVALPSTVWPANGQAAVQIGQSQVHAGPHQHAAAIASVAKVMTAYLVLRDHPLGPGEEGPTITLTDADVADTERRNLQQESVVSIAAGEQLTELQALHALLLPSANNIAAVLARWDAGSSERFVARMNAAARSLGMTHTRYTDPSGYDNATVSTAADQVRLVDRAMRLPVFASIVATQSATLPVAGTVQHQQAAGVRGVRRRQDRLDRGRRRLLRLPGRPLDPRQADDDHRGRASPAARPRGSFRGRRDHGRPHHRSSGCARWTAGNLAAADRTLSSLQRVSVVCCSSQALNRCQAFDTRGEKP
jgi:serine-type D-Ala-D-Ala carboxypeptidase (penicillin-binding protein 5/6)